MFQLFDVPKLYDTTWIKILFQVGASIIDRHSPAHKTIQQFLSEHVGYDLIFTGYVEFGIGIERFFAGHSRWTAMHEKFKRSYVFDMTISAHDNKSHALCIGIDLGTHEIGDLIPFVQMYVGINPGPYRTKFLCVGQFQDAIVIGQYEIKILIGLFDHSRKGLIQLRWFALYQYIYIGRGIGIDVVKTHIDPTRKLAGKAVSRIAIITWQVSVDNDCVAQGCANQCSIISSSMLSKV